jgi:hypothetical protein
MMVIEGLIKSLRDAAVYNPDIQVAPVCILWPDRDRKWEAVVPRLQIELPELFILGDYAPEKRTGPAVWLRCVMAGTIEDIKIPGDKTPILYLPGVGRQDLRAVDTCPPELNPLVELQYSGVTWSQVNNKDWTVLAFLKSEQGGLGLDVAQDKASLKAMHLVLYRLLDEEPDRIKSKRLDKDFFNNLLIGGDPVRDLLQWLDHSDTFRGEREETHWQGFVEICKSRWGFDPENEGTLDAAAKLAAHQGPWQPIWERFCEAPIRYPHIPGFIRQTSLPADLFADKTGWPQWNEKEEKSLRTELLKTGQMTPQDARELLLKLEEKHKTRRQLVWAELGESSLACALEGLALMAETTGRGLAAGTLEDMISGYVDIGWHADDAILKALAQVETQEDLEAVRTAIRAVYLPWAEESAQHLQNLAESIGYPGGTIETKEKSQFSSGQCVVFVDGLRFDLGKRLSGLLNQSGLHVEEHLKWAALPTITATGKPAVTPAADLIQGQHANPDFEPCAAATGKSLKGGYHLQKLLEASGWKILDKLETGTGASNAWCESGDIDHEGHHRGWKLVHHLDSKLSEIKTRIQQLIQAGWQQVRVVTDHGWLLLPGGLPKIELPASLAEHKWGRCAALKTGAKSRERLFPWYWNPGQHTALANGINCYRSGREYTHGGLSFQECLTLELIVTSPLKGMPGQEIKITGFNWRGLRCIVEVGGNYHGLSVDIRKHAGNAKSSLVIRVKKPDDQGKASVVVEDEKYEGTGAFIVLVDENGQLAAQAATIIGGGKT